MLVDNEIFPQSVYIVTFAISQEILQIRNQKCKKMNKAKTKEAACQFSGHKNMNHLSPTKQRQKILSSFQAPHITFPEGFFS